MASNQIAVVPIAALTFIGCLLVALGLFAAGSVEIVGLGLGSLIVAAVLGTIVSVVGSRRS
jgi:hypothetical protein